MLPTKYIIEKDDGLYKVSVALFLPCVIVLENKSEVLGIINY